MRVVTLLLALIYTTLANQTETNLQANVGLEESMIALLTNVTSAEVKEGVPKDVSTKSLRTESKNVAHLEEYLKLMFPSIVELLFQNETITGPTKKVVCKKMGTQKFCVGAEITL